MLLLLAGLVFVALREPGYEYTPLNRATHWLRVRTALDLEYSATSADLSETDFLAQYPGIDWDCGHEPSAMGERSCFSSIRSFNGAEAWFAAAFFEKDRLSQLKVDLMPAGWERVLSDARRRFGEPRRTGRPGQTPVVFWRLDRGVVGINEQAYDGEPSQLLWVSDRKALAGALERALR